MNILESVVLEHQVFSRLNLNIEIFYLENGWAIKSPLDQASFSQEKDTLQCVIGTISFFIKSKTTNTKEIKAVSFAESNFFFFSGLYAFLECKKENSLNG